MSEVLYTTEDLSKMFHVGKSTIKRWTDEGKLHCFKTPGGHRKFKPESVQQFITHYHYEVSTPVFTFSRQASETTNIANGALNLSMVENCFINAINAKRQPIEESLSVLFSEGKTLPIIFDTFLTPLLRMIHTKQQNRLITAVEFQIAKSTLIDSLIHFTDQIPKSEKNDTKMYCLSVNEGMNEVELKAVELLLENMGMTIYNLGTVLTKYAAHDIVEQCKPEDVFLVLSLDHLSDDIIQQFNSLVSGVNLHSGNVYTSSFFEEEQTGIVLTQPSHFYSFLDIVEQFSLALKVA